MARKQVTIPLGFNTANIDIGNKNQVSGYNWEFWYAYIGDVRNTLSEDNYNVGKLCTSTNINIWAAFKPTRHIPQTVPKHYHGWELGGGGELEYQRPNNTTGYDLGHFLGYNHDAVEPGAIRYNSSYVYRVFDTLVEQSVGLLIALPEFDLRDIDSNIEGVIATVGGTDYFSIINDTAQINGETLIDADVTPTDVTKYTFTVENISLGEDNLGVPDPFCRFPSATGAQLDKDVDLYRIINEANSWYSGSVQNEVIVYMKQFHADILVRYEIDRWDGVYGVSGGWVNKHSGATAYYIDSDVSVGETYYYRGRVVYNRGGGTANLTTSYSETNITTTSGGSGGDPPI